MINVKIPGTATSADKDAIVKFAPIFEELQAVLVLHSSKRLSCAKNCRIWIECKWS